MKKLLNTAIIAGIFVSAGITSVYADVEANALPGFNHGTNVDITTKDNNMNIQIQGGQHSVGTAHWDTFNIGKDASVNVEFTAHNQTSMNYVDAAGGMSQIYGKFTDSGCLGCGYDATGKVILLNPNGVLFGPSAVVNLNSFTASNMDGTYSTQSNKTGLLQLSKYTKANPLKGTDSDINGIVVQEGAKIYGDKNVSFAANNINIYKNSQITTNTKLANTTIDGNAVPIGKVKLVTADGVNFAYQPSGFVDSLSNINPSADNMTLHIEGNIASGHIDARNASTNVNSEINTKGANLRAYRAETGSDGNIWLTANNRITTEKSTFVTSDVDDNASNRTDGGNVLMISQNKTTLNNDNVSAVGNVTLKTKGADGKAYVDTDKVNRTNDGSVNVHGSLITAKNITLDSAEGIASAQNGSTLNGADVTIKGKTRAQVVNSVTIDSDNFDISADNIWFDGAKISSKGKINAKASNGDVLSTKKSSVTQLAADDIIIDASTNVTGPFDLQNNKTTIKAGNDIDVTLTNVSNRNAGLIAEAGNNVTIVTPGTLSVSRLVAKNGNMTLDAQDIIAGTPMNNIDPETKFEDTPEDRSFISVRNGEFKTSPDMTVTKSGGEEFTKDGVTYQVKHNIQYGDQGVEKILLINPRAKAAEQKQDESVIPPVTPAQADVMPAIDEDQASMLNKIPRSPEAFDDRTDIVNNRVMVVDMFAAAAQIEVDEDENEY